MLGGIQRQFQEAMQGMVVGMESAGKESTGNENLKGIPKPIMSTVGQTCTQSGKQHFWRTCGLLHGDGDEELTRQRVYELTLLQDDMLW